MPETITLTEQQAHVVAEVLATADGYCPSCQTRIAEHMQERCPDYNWLKLVMEADDDRG